MLRVVSSKQGQAGAGAIRTGDDPCRCDSCPTRIACMASHLSASERALLPDIFDAPGPIQGGEHLYRVGDRVNAQFHVRSGMFKTYAINAEGDEYVTGFYLPGDILGHAQIDGHHAESAVALETSSVCELTDAGVAECARNGMAAILVRMFGEHSVQGTRHQLNLKQTSAQARFAGFCLLLSDRLAGLGRSAEHLPTPMSRTDIASYLGMTLESLSRVISRLTQAGVIKASRNHIEIVQPKTLETFGMHVR